MAINVSDLLYPTGYDSDFSTKTTSDLTEGANLYYTTTRANSAIDARVDKAFVDALNVDADTLDNQNGTFYLDYTNFTNTPADSAAFETQFATKTTTDLPEGTNQYFTTTRARQSVSAAGDLSYVEGTGVFSVTTYKSADFNTDFSGKSTADLSEGTNQYFTNTRARNAISVSGDLSYDAGTGVISYTDVDSDAFVTQLAASSTTNLSEGTNLYYTQGRFDTAFTAKSTTDLSEGTNLYHTTSRVRNAISVSGDLSYDAGTGVISYTDVDSDAFVTQLAASSTTNLSEGTNLYYTVARANSAIDARVNKAFVDALNVDADTLDGEDGTHYRIDVYDAAGTLLN